MEKQGKNLSPMDMLIAANAIANNCVLVTNDQAFVQVEALKVEDWTVWFFQAAWKIHSAVILYSAVTVGWKPTLQQNLRFCGGLGSPPYKHLRCFWWVENPPYKKRRTIVRRFIKQKQAFIADRIRFLCLLSRWPSFWFGNSVPKSFCGFRGRYRWLYSRRMGSLRGFGCRC